MRPDRGEAEANRLALVLRDVRPEQAVPHDEDGPVVRVEVRLVAPVVDAV